MQCHHAFAVTLSALPIFQPAQGAWLKQHVYAALRTDHADLGFVVRGDIATPSMVRARSSYSDAVNAAARRNKRAAVTAPREAFCANNAAWVHG